MTTESVPVTTPAMSGLPTTEPRPPETAPPGELREVRYEHSLNWAPLLTRLGATCLISTYQAGKLVLVSAAEGRLHLSFHNFERAMGVAWKPDVLAVGTRAQVWFLANAADLAPQLEPRGRRDACYLTRSARFTGDVHGHEMAWAGDELWLVNTRFSCLCTLHERYHFVPRWRPPFVSALAADDRCHLNGLCLVNGRPRYVTALAETDSPQGWRPLKVTGGCLIDVAANAVVARGFAMPHSPRGAGGRVWVLDSGRGRLVTVDPASGTSQTVAEFPGYPRGLALHEGLAFVGLSKIRETSTFGGLPIAERRGELKCGVAVVELATGRQMAFLEFHAGVDEIFDVHVLPGVRSPVLSGPYPHLDQGQAVWTVPDAATAAALTAGRAAG